MTTIQRTLRLLHESLTALETCAEHDPVAALKAAHAHRQALEQFDVAAVAQLQRDGVFAAHGYRKPELAIADLLGIERGQARQIVITAQSISERTGPDGQALAPALPATAAAFAAGAATVRHVDVIARVLASRPAEHLTPQVRAHLEAHLAGLAAEHTPRKLHDAGTELVELLDHDRDDTDQQPPAQVNELHITLLPGGGGRIKGRFDDPARFQTILSLLDAKSRPLTADDTRTPAERQADALVDVCAYVTEHADPAVAPEAGGRRPGVTLIAQLQLDEMRLRLRAACLPFGGSLTPESLRMMCCDAAIIPMTMDGAGQPLDIGTTSRTIPLGLRRAVEARDRGCAHPGCDRPVSWSQIHHIVHWEHGGPTSLANLVMLCRVHHRQIHATEWEVRIGKDGIPEFIPPPFIDPEQRPRCNPRNRISTWDIVRAEPAGRVVEPC